MLKCKRRRSTNHFELPLPTRKSVYSKDNYILIANPSHFVKHFNTNAIPDRLNKLLYANINLQSGMNY